MRLIVIVALVACGKGESKQEAPVASLANLHATLDGKPLTFDRAFIKTASPGVWTVLVGAGSCDSNDAKFGFTVQKRVGPMGHESHILTDLWSRDFDATVPLGGKVAILDEDAIAKGRVTRVILPPMEGTRFRITKGQIEAVGCATPEPTGAGVPEVAHPSKGTILVAGKKLKVGGVTVRVRKGAAATDLPNITISTRPLDCSGITLPAPLILERTDGKWSLHGTWFEERLDVTEPTDLTFSANNAGKSVDGPTILLQMSGKGTFGGYTLDLFGTAEAIECTN